MSSTAVLPRQKAPFLPDINNHAKCPSAQDRKSSKRRGQNNEKDGDSPRSESASVTKDDVAEFRSPLRQRVCVCMLRGGFHRSFWELLSLLRRWSVARREAGPGSALWQAWSLEEQPVKLQTLQHHLTRAEAASRAGQYAEVYENRLALARYFSDPMDDWLRVHFHQSALSAARSGTMDTGRREAEANADMGHVYMEQGQLEQAREHYEAFHHLAVGRAWTDSAGHTLHSRACVCLCRVYTHLAERTLQSRDYRPAIQMLNRALDMAKEAGDKSMEGEAAYRVGLAYQSVGDQQTAKRFLSVYMEISTALDDADSLGKAYKAIAKSLESEGKLTDTIQYLEKFAEVSNGNNHHHNLQEACMSLATVYSSRGQYEHGCVCYERAYELALTLGSVDLIQKASVCVGSARAHAKLRAYSTHTEAATHTHTHTLIAWKEDRTDGFNQPPHGRK